MTHSSQLISANILDFDDEFERTLRRKKKDPELHPSSSSSASNLKEEEEPTTREEEEVQTMAVDNRTIKELSASGMDNAAPLCIQYPRAAQDKIDKFELKSSLLHHIPKFHGGSQQAFEGVRGGVFKHDSN
ncbi:S ribonuclease [Pyrus ussuriensis x Pyrus communis]|uniref:S ribonuclease n=1 Tax=Pyrus ussuriensis x Pyrus communis TaxID=2448454 RepID=A0A5N5FT52_9ROSA|nr:S ribonuclease [Pyrus ussuriensis x Pyrus communis]